MNSKIDKRKEKQHIYKQKTRRYTVLFQQELEKIKIYKDNLKNLENEYKRGYIFINMAKTHLSCIGIQTIILDIFYNTFNSRSDSIIRQMVSNCSACLTSLENVILQFYNPSPTEIEESLKSITEIAIEDKVVLIKEIGFFIDYIGLLSDKDGHIKWTLVDFHKRLVIIAKNFENPKLLGSKRDPMINKENYLSWVLYINLVTRLLQNAANMLKERYEANKGQNSKTTTQDFIDAIELLKLLSQFLFQANELEKQLNVKKQIEIWEQRLKKEQAQQKNND